MAMKPSSVAIKAWLLAMSPVIAYAGHHPGHRATESAGGGAVLWIVLGIVALVGIMALVTRKRK
jgi:hypothetical protein